MRDNRPVTDASPTSLPELQHRLHSAIAASGGWLPFDRFMAMALYEPGLGYYTNALQKFGTMPDSGSDFVTAPGMTPLFGQTLAVQVGEALRQTGAHEVFEFGAGTGALALQLLDALGDGVQRYTIIDLSGTLRERQARALADHAHKLRWLDAWPEAIEGVVVGNEVLDAMPVQLLVRKQGVWHERGVETPFSGEVTGVIGAGAFVAFDDGAFEGFMPVRKIGGDWWELNEQGTILVGTRSGGAIRLGDRVEVVVERVDTARGRVDLLPVEPETRR